MTVRILGIETLTKVLNVKSNVKSFEELIYKISKKDDKLYKKLLYQFVYDISMNKSIKSLYIDLLDKNIDIKAVLEHKIFPDTVKDVREAVSFLWGREKRLMKRPKNKESLLLLWEYYEELLEIEQILQQT